MKKDRKRDQSVPSSTSSSSRIRSRSAAGAAAAAGAGAGAGVLLALLVVAVAGAGVLMCWCAGLVLHPGGEQEAPPAPGDEEVYQKHREYCCNWIQNILLMPGGVGGEMYL